MDNDRVLNDPPEIQEETSLLINKYFMEWPDGAIAGVDYPDIIEYVNQHGSEALIKQRDKNMKMIEDALKEGWIIN